MTDTPLPGFERAGEEQFATHKEYARTLAKARPEWDFTSYSDGSYTLTYLSGEGGLLVEDDYLWTAGDIDFEQESARFQVSIRCDDLGYNEAAPSQRIADSLMDIQTAIDTLITQLRKDHIIE